MKKKIICYALLMSLLLASAAFPLSAEAARKIGDVDGNGSINAVDYSILKRIYLDTYTPTEAELAACDVNGDETLTPLDYLMLKRHVLGTYEIIQPVINYRTSVSGGKQYVKSVSEASNYADSYNCQLTDGAFAANGSSYTDTRFVGFNSNVEVVIDLGNDGKRLNGFEASYLSFDGAGIYAPASVSVYGSGDNSAWTLIGNAEIPAFVNRTVQKAVFNPTSEVEYRYVKFAVTKTMTWVFLDELTVFANVESAGGTAGQEMINEYTADNTTDSQKQSIISGISGEAYDALTGMTVISGDCDYAINCSEYDWRTDYALDGLLTNKAAIGTSFESEEWVGISASTATDITIDLGAVQDDICAFSLDAFMRDVSGINLPTYVDIYAGSDLDNLVVVGRSYAISPNSAGQENYTFRVTLGNVISARYVRFSMPAGNGCYWFEEASVFGNREKPVAQDFLYPEISIPEITIPSYWQSGEPDYTLEQNLILGKPHMITSDVELDYSTAIENNAPAETPLLTDGTITENTNCYNGIWCQFNSGGGRTVIYDLGKTSSVTGFQVGILDYNDWGITLPEKVNLILSEDGVNWYLAKSIPLTHDDDKKILRPSAILETPVCARYAAVYFPVVGHVFIDEIIISGTKSVSSSTALAEAGLAQYVLATSSSTLGYAAPDENILGGVNDVMLVYHTGTTVNEDFLLPYVAYLNEENQITDTMFDGFLFLPTTGSLPSGGRPYGESIKSDWMYLFDDIFGSNVCLEALDSVAARVKTALSLSDYKLKVFITIPHMDEAITDFGDVDGDGVSENLSVASDRLKVALWYTSLVKTTFNVSGYSNLELCGFYWFHEAISGNDVTTAQQVSAAMSENGDQLFWIPYYQAAGFASWSDFGFAAGCLQPNYAFNLGVDESRLYFASRLAQRYGMSIELELDGSAFSDERYFRKYMDYMSGGVTYGYMNESVHMYYQGVSDFRTSCYSGDKKLRLIYEYTYDFIKGTLNITPETAEDIIAYCNENEVYNGKLSNDQSKVRIYELSSSPAHGTVSVGENGNYTYYPNKGFKGTDTFTYRISEYLGWSEECVVSIVVD